MNVTCPICYNDYSGSQTGLVGHDANGVVERCLPQDNAQMHITCERCIKTWAQTSKLCPTCRKPLDITRLKTLSEKISDTLNHPMAKMAAVGVGLFSGSFAFPALTATLAFGYVTKQRITKFKDNTLTHLRMVDLIKDRFIRPLVDQLELDLGPDLEMGLFDSPKRAVLNEIQDRLPVDLDLLLRISDPSDEVSKIVKECLFERFGIHSLRLPDYQPSPVRTETATRFIQGLKDISPVLSRLSSIKTDWKHELSSFAKGTAYQAIIYLLWMRC